MSLPYNSRRVSRLTVSAIANDPVQDSYELRDNTIHLVESCKYGDDIRARIGVFLAQHAGQESCQSLEMRVREEGFSTKYWALHPRHRSWSAKLQRPLRGSREKTNAEFAPGVDQFSAAKLCKVLLLTCKPNISSGPNWSSRACSSPRSGGSKKNSRQNPSDGSASSEVYVENQLWQRDETSWWAYFEEILVQLHDLRLEGFGSGLLG